MIRTHHALPPSGPARSGRQRAITRAAGALLVLTLALALAFLPALDTMLRIFGLALLPAAALLGLMAGKELPRTVQPESECKQ